jgi:hypothetical protein
MQAGQETNVQAHCMNTDRTDFWGRKRTQVVTVPHLQVLPLWIALQIPSSANSANISG